MASFRLRTPAEYLQLLWEKRYFVLVPFVIVGAAMSYAIYKLPNVYESKSQIIVDPPKVSSNYVQPVSSLDVNTRLATIRKLVTSRTELERLIERFDLYPEMRKRNAATEEIVNEMLKHIDVKQNAVSQTINYFSVHFVHADPLKARDVTQELTTRIINANSDAELQRVYQTLDNLDERVKNVRTDLEKIEAERADYLMKNPDAVEGQDASLANQLNSLSVVRQSQQTSIDSLRNQITTNEQMVAAMKTQVVAEPESAASIGLADGQLRTRRAELEGQLLKLLSEYTEKAPEVKAVRAQIEALNREFDDLNKKDELGKQLKRTERSGGNLQVQQLELKIAADKRDLQKKETDLTNTNQLMSDLRQRLGGVPMKAIYGLKIDRDYNTLRTRYDELLKQQDAAKFSAKVINDFSGETFRLIDPASLPETPVSPKRNILYPLSVLLGLLVGLLSAAASAGRSLLTIRDARDIAHYAHLPLLVTVPRLVTAQERKLLPVINAAKVIGAIFLIGVATPLLYQVIKLSGVLNAFTQAAF
jgi:polysaccharide chain length determinant protein (PEP-CTERM system associated)